MITQSAGEPVPGSLHALGTGPSDIVIDLAVDPAGDLVLVGAFQVVGGVTSPNAALYDVPRPVASIGNVPESSGFALAVSPNPVTSGGTVRVTLTESESVRVAVYDVLGRQVVVLADQARSAGEHTFDLGAERLVPGVYVVRVTGGASSAVQRVAVAR